MGESTVDTIRRVDLTRALLGMSRAMLRARHRDDVLQDVCDAAVEDGTLCGACVDVPAAEGESWRTVARSGTVPERPAAPSALLRTLVQADPAHSFAIVPVGRDFGRGVMTLCAPAPAEFSERDITELEQTAADLALSLRRPPRRPSAMSDSLIRRFAAIVESSNDAIISKTIDGTITSWNPAAERMFGYKAADIIGHNILLLIPPSREAEEPIILERIGRGERIVDVETVRVRKGGAEFPVSITVSPLRASDGTIIGASKIVRDITDRRQAARALQRSNASLESRVRERTAELAVAKERAESADRLKSAFLATMSHELRTPLNSIIGFTGLILQEMAGPLSVEQSTQLSMVQGSARHLLSLINDVLDISKIEAGQFRLHHEDFDPLPSVQRVAALVEPLAAAKGLSLSVQSPTSLSVMHSDQRRIEQVLLNLLNNSVKFTERGRVVLAVDPLEMAPLGVGGAPMECLRFKVMDTGVGIRPEDLPDLFKPFHQVDSGLTRMHEGTGLGLAICKRLCEMLGGSIAVISHFGKGSEFSFILPRQPVGSHA